MRHFSHAPDPEHTFRLLYEAVYPDLIRFVQRRAHPDPAVNRVDLGRVWRLISEVHQEALGLAVFEERPQGTAGSSCAGHFTRRVPSAAEPCPPGTSTPP